MIKIICGEKGKGKTKDMLAQANDCVAASQGSVVYLDKSSQHNYDLNNQIRLINVTEYPGEVASKDGFVGFVSGLLAGNYDITTVFVDSFLKLASIEGAEGLVDVCNTLESINKDVTFVLSISLDENDIPEELKEAIIVSC